MSTYSARVGAWTHGAVVTTPPSGSLFWQQFPTGMKQTSGGSASGDGDPVGQWLDQSGNGNDALQATSGLRPVADTVYGGIVMPVGTLDLFNLTPTFNKQSCSLFAVCEPLGVNQAFLSGSPSQYQVIYSSSGFSIFINGATNKLGYWVGSGSLIDTTLDVPTSRCLIGMVSSVAGLTLIVNSSSQTVAALGSASISALTVGSAAADSPMPGRLQALLGYSSPLDAPSLTQVRAWAQYLSAVFDAANIVAFEGDSLSFASITTQNRGWNQTLALGSRALQYNFALPGQTMVQVASANRSGAIYNGAKRNVLIVFAGTNDISGGTTGADTYTSLSAFCTSRRSQGFKVAVITMLPRGSLETQRQVYNNAIRGGWTGFADALIDVETAATIGAVGANTNTTYYNVDQVHLNNTGHAVLEGLAITQINSLMV